jgi:oxygen-dependent protoporphyrinogen oxidase
VVGAGIAGLAGAQAAIAEARRAGIDVRVTVLEAGERIGGKLWTEEADGVTVEWGPDSFLAAKPRGRGLAEELGVGLVPVAAGARRAFLLRSGRLKPIPDGLVMGVPTTAGSLRTAVREELVSLPGAARAAVEPLIPGGSIGEPDEPAAAVARRRLGREAADRLVEPLLRGVFGAPGTEIGVRSAFPMAVGNRSLVRALRRRPGGGAQFLGVRGGFGRLVDALVSALPAGSVRAGASVVSIRPAAGGGFEVITDAGAELGDAVLVATPADAAAAMLAGIAPESSAALRDVRYGASAVVVLRYPSTVRVPDGSGYLVDPEEGGTVAACSWFSSKWPDLAGGRVVFRAVVTDPSRLAAPDDELRDRVAAEVSRTIGARTGPDVVRMRRWEQALPVFGPGHGERMRAATAALPDGIALAGAFLGAVGVPDCIESGESAARGLIGHLARPAGARQ